MGSKIAKIIPPMIGGVGGSGVASITAGAGIVVGGTPTNPTISATAKQVLQLAWVANPTFPNPYYLIEGEQFWRDATDGSVTAFAWYTQPLSQGTIGINSSQSFSAINYAFWDGTQLRYIDDAAVTISNIDALVNIGGTAWGKTGIYNSTTTAAFARGQISRGTNNEVTGLNITTGASGIYYNNQSLCGSELGGATNSFNVTARQMRFKATVMI